MITDWIKDFSKSWIDKDIEAILALFSEDVEYWETPFKRISPNEQLAKEWQAIKLQENIDLSIELFNSEGQKHAVQWRLQYDKDGKQHKWAGVYLIELDSNGLCLYFKQIGEEHVG